MGATACSGIRYARLLAAAGALAFVWLIFQIVLGATPASADERNEDSVLGGITTRVTDAVSDPASSAVDSATSAVPKTMHGVAEVADGKPPRPATPASQPAAPAEPAAQPAPPAKTAPDSVPPAADAGASSPAASVVKAAAETTVSSVDAVVEYAVRSVPEAPVAEIVSPVAGTMSFLVDPVVSEATQAVSQFGRAATGLVSYVGGDAAEIVDDVGAEIGDAGYVADSESGSAPTNLPALAADDPATLSDAGATSMLPARTAFFASETDFGAALASATTQAVQLEAPAHSPDSPPSPADVLGSGVAVTSAASGNAGAFADQNAPAVAAPGSGIRLSVVDNADLPDSFTRELTSTPD